MIVSVVIPSHDGLRFLAPCLDALERSVLPTGVELEILVVDNGSRDGTRALLASRPGVKAIFSDRPLGFARANNAARREARGDVVCFLNNDTQVSPNWLLRPLEILRADARVAAVGAKLLFMHRFVPIRVAGRRRAFIAAQVFGGPLDDKVRYRLPASPEVVHRGTRGRWVGPEDVIYVPEPVPGVDEIPALTPTLRVLEVDSEGPLTVKIGDELRVLRSPPGIVPLPLMTPSGTVRLVQNAGNYLTARGEGGDVGSGEEALPGRHDAEEIVPALCGAAMLVRRSALDRAGWFPSYYTMYYEDADLCLRLRQRGGLLVFCPSSVVSHYHTGTSRENSPRFVEHVARSTVLFVGRYGDAALIARTIARKARDSAREFRHVRAPNARGRWRSASGTRGFAKGLLALPIVLADRALAARLLSEGPLFGGERSPYEGPGEPT